MLFAIVICAGYLIGSFPSAVWVGKIFHSIDIREHGSHNAGATNTFRVLGKRWGWFVLVLDVGKGFLAASIPFFLSSFYLGFKDEVLILQLMASFFAILGHGGFLWAISGHVGPNLGNVGPILGSFGPCCAI